MSDAFFPDEPPRHSGPPAGRHAGGDSSDSNAAPLLHVDEPPARSPAAPPGRNRLLTAFIGGASNCSISYNLTALSVGMAFLHSASGKAQWPEPDWAKRLLMGIAFVGTVLGMLTMGWLADRYGRRTGLLVTQTLVVLGAVITAACPWGSPNTFYGMIALGRLLLGVGVGGTYPCAFAAVMEAGTTDARSTATDLALSYFAQTPASAAPYALAWVVAVSMPADAYSTQFRLLLALGAVPAAVAWWAAFRCPQELPASHQAGARKATTGMLAQLRDNKVHLWTLCGTGGCWLLYDLCWYGTVVFLPDLLGSIFGSDEAITAMCWQSLVLVAVGVPGTLAAIAAMQRRGARWLNVWGFAAIAACFAAMAALYFRFPTPGDAAAGKFACFCMLCMALSSGPTVGLHVLAASAFPAAVRATFFGLSSAGGKVGALVGTLLFPSLTSLLGVGGLMIVQVVLSLLGVLLSVVFLRSDAHEFAPEPFASSYPDVQAGLKDSLISLSGSKITGGKLAHQGSKLELTVVSLAAIERTA